MRAEDFLADVPTDIGDEPTGFVEFDGELDAEPTGFVEFDGELDAPAPRRGTLRSGAKPYVAEDPGRPMTVADLRKLEPKEPEPALLDKPAPSPDPMLRREYIEARRLEYGKLPQDRQLDALRKDAQRTDVVGRAAKALLVDAERLNANARQAAQQSPETVRALMAAPTAPRASGVGPAKPKLPTFIDATPTIGEIMDGTARGERLAKRGAGATIAAADSSAQAFRDKAELLARDFDGEAFARDNPMIASVASGGGKMVAGVANAVPLVMDFAAKLIDADSSRAPNAIGFDDIKRTADSLMPKIGRQSLEEAWDKDEFGGWLATNLAAQAPQYAASALAAFVPALRPMLLPMMGAQTAGLAYGEGDSSAAAVASGLVEAGSELLPLAAFDRARKALMKLPPAIRGDAVSAVGKRLAAVGTFVGTQGIVGAIEETAAQVGQNIVGNVIDGKNKALLDQAADAAVLGVFGSAALSVPQAVGVLAPQSRESAFANAFAQDTAEREFQQAPSDEFARRAMSPSFYDPAAVVPTMPRPVAAEEMPADRVLTPQELDAERAQADAVRADALAAAQIAQRQVIAPTDMPGNVPSGPQAAPNAPAGYVGGPEPRKTPVATPIAPEQVAATAAGAAQQRGKPLTPGQVAQGSLLSRVKGAAVEPTPAAAEYSDSQVPEVAQPSVDAMQARQEQALSEGLTKTFATKGWAIMWLAENRMSSKLKPVQDGASWRVEPVEWSNPTTAAPAEAVAVDDEPNRENQRKTEARRRRNERQRAALLPEQPAAEPAPSEPAVEAPAPEAAVAPAPAVLVTPDQVDRAPDANVAPPAAEVTPEAPDQEANQVDREVPDERIEVAAAAHADPGESPEPATAAVIDESLQRAASVEQRKPSVMRADLLKQIDAAIGAAPAADAEIEPERLTFDVPGDGVFTVMRTKERLVEFRKQVAASAGFKNRQTAPKPAGGAGLHLGSPGSFAAIKAMLDEGDAQAALDYASAKGIDLRQSLGGDRVRLRKIEGLVPTGQREQEAAKPVEQPAPAASLDSTSSTDDDARGADAQAESISDAEAFADDYARFDGRSVEQSVLVRDTGETATLSMDAAAALRDLDASLAALERGASDLDLKDAIAEFGVAGMNHADAERVARGDARANLQADRDEIVALLRAQHPDLFTPERARISDAGEKIGGARKDRWRERGLNLADLDEMSEAEGASVVSKSVVWAPDYEAMVTGGMTPELASLVKGVYDSLAAKPRDNTPAGRRHFVTAMQAVREVYGSLQGADALGVMRAAAEALRGKLGIDSGLRAFDDDQQAKRRVLFSVYKGRSDPFALGYDAMRRAQRLVADGFPAKVQPWVRRFDILPAGGAGSTAQGVARMVEQSVALGTPLTADEAKAGAFTVVARKSRKTAAMATSKAGAEAAARAIYERELKSSDDKATPERPHLDVLERAGLDKHIERDATADDFLSEFGFRGVEFGNWTAQDERQKMLNLAFDGLHDLAQIIGVSPKAMSLNGTLGMAFGARGGGRFAAHYEPGKLVINLTKLQGGGSMAHEWAHALDHYFGELDRADAYSTTARGASGWYAQRPQGKPLPNLRPETSEAFNAVMKAIFTKSLPQAETVRRAELNVERAKLRLQEAEAEGNTGMALVYREAVQQAEKSVAEARAGKPAGSVATDFAKQAVKLSGKSTNGYWQRPTEMFARAFESYVFDRLIGMGAKSEYLVHGVESDRFAGGSYKGNPYPVGDEREALNGAFGKLFDTIKTRDSGKGVAMFLRRPGASGMTAGEVSDAVTAITASWANAPKIEVIASMKDAPEPVKRENDRQVKGGAKGVPAAFVFGGKVFVVASEMGDAATVAEAVLHEVLGHYGLRGAFGSALDDVLAQVVKDRPELLRAKLDSYGLGFDNEADRLIAAEEVLAEMAQTDPRASVVQRAIAAIRQWLREFMPALKLSDAEILVRIIEPARAFVVAESLTLAQPTMSEDAALRALADSDEMFALPKSDKLTVEGIAAGLSSADAAKRIFYRRVAGPIDSAAFKAWFGKSKAVDEDGAPLRLYHGTARNFAEFRASKSGTLGPGMYFTADPNKASVYADSMAGARSPASVMPVFISIKNPLVVRVPKLPEVRRDDVFYGRMVGTDVATKAFEGGSDPRADGKLKTQLITAWAKGDYFGEPIRKKLIEQGYDGVIAHFDDPADGSTEYVAFHPTQIKSATGNIGTYDPNNPDIRFQRLIGRHSLREFGRGAQIIETLQDRYNRWKQAIEDIRKQGGLITDENDFYKAEERYWGRVGTKLDDFHDELRDFVRAVAKDGVTLEQVALYAYAEHAPERNAYIASKRADMQGNGAGMTDDEAAKVIDDARQAGTEDVLRKHAATIRQWTQGTRDVLYDGGLITAEQHDAWTGMFESYVPLRGFDDEVKAGTPRPGFNIRGQEGKHADGRYSRATHILEEVVRDRTRALLRVGKNDVLRSLAQFVLDNPSPNLWSVEAVDAKPDAGLNESGERLIADDAPVADDHVTLKDAGREIRVFIRDRKLLDQLRAVNREDNPSRPIAALLLANRVLGRLYTSMSPVFTVVNAARDVQAAAVGLIDEIGLMAAPKLFAKLPKALYEAWRAEAGYKSADYQLFSAMGGKTSFFNLRDIDAQAAELQWLVKHGERSTLNPAKFGVTALRLIESINSGIENATRLAAFKVAREAGKSEPQAASIAKNITVNFNRRGTQQLASAWILFFNPAVQGTARIVQSLKHPRVISTLGVAMMGVFALALRNAGMGEDDDGVSWWDKIPDSVKERNFVIVLPPGASSGEGVPGSKIGRYVKVPMPYGYNFFAVVANQVVDLWRRTQDPRRGKDAKEAAVNAFSAPMNSWLPVGSLGQAMTASSDEAGGKGLVLMATPDALDPIAQSMLNQSAFGREMSPDNPGAKNLPDSSNYFASQAGTPFQRAVGALNRATGGSKYESGLIDLSPATLESLTRGYLGAPMTFGLDVINAMRARHSIERPELDAKRLPFAKQFYGVINDETDRMAGYARLDKAEAAIEPVKRAKKAGDETEVDRLLTKHGAVAELGNVAQRTRRRLSELSKREREIVEGDQQPGDKYALLMENAAQKRLVLQDFTQAYDDAVLYTANQKKRGKP